MVLNPEIRSKLSLECMVRCVLGSYVGCALAHTSPFGWKWHEQKRNHSRATISRFAPDRQTDMFSKGKLKTFSNKSYVQIM